MKQPIYAALFYILGATIAGGWIKFGPEPTCFVDWPASKLLVAADTPKLAALKFYGCFSRNPDAPKIEHLKVSVARVASDRAIVTIIDPYVESDSTDVTCNRYTLRRTPRGWEMLRHQAAWQGRGRIGWTTEPTI